MIFFQQGTQFASRLEFKMYSKLFVLFIFLGIASIGMCEEDKEKSSRVDLGDIAKEIMGRSGNSQVLSLNLTNLVILLVLKGLLFGFTMYGGNHAHGYKGRSLDSEEFISETEVMLITSYLMGDTNQNFECLYRVACQDPKKSKQYLQAAKILLKGSKMISDIVGYDEKYENLITNIQEAIEFGSKYGTCEKKYSCSTKSDSRR